MKNIILILILLFIKSFSYGQLNLDCFSNIRIKLDSLRNVTPPIKTFSGDSISIDNLNKDTAFIASLDSAITHQKPILNELIGCPFPKDYFRATNGNLITIDSIKSSFIVVNFNYLYDAGALGQLDDLVKLKRESNCAGQLNEDITIISFFSHTKPEIQYLIDKYKAEIIFVSDASNYIEKYSLGLGYPFNFLIDKKNIKYAETGYSYDKGVLYLALKPFVK